VSLIKRVRMVSAPEKGAGFFNLRKKLFGSAKKDRIHVKNVPGYMEHEYLKTLPNTEENRKTLHEERLMRSAAGENVYILLTTQDSTEGMPRENRRNRRWRDQLLKRLMRPLVRRATKVTPEQILEVEEEIDRSFAEREGSELVLPGGQEPLEIKRVKHD
ncbi:hypothetical protein LCGC14_2778150, partial [marine sediment metagenome]